MKIRDSHAVLNGDTTTFEAKSGSIEIIDTDNKALFDLSVDDDGELQVRAVGYVFGLRDEAYSERLLVRPIVSNAIGVSRMMEKDSE